MLEKREMGRFSVDLIVANNRDVVNLGDGDDVLEHVKHVIVPGVVDSGAARLILPQHVVDELQLKVDGEMTVRFAYNRRAKRQIVNNVWLQLLGRHSVFTAVVEPARDDALIGAIVLEELDLLVDCGTQTLYPREPDSILTEIE
jgi:predicted aspartyl protease